MGIKGPVQLNDGVHDRFVIYVDKSKETPRFELNHAPKRKEWLVGNLILTFDNVKSYTLYIRSTRRSTMIASVKLLPNGEYGIYLKNVFDGVGNKAIIVEHLRKIVNQYFQQGGLASLMDALKTRTVRLMTGSNVQSWVVPNTECLEGLDDPNSPEEVVKQAVVHYHEMTDPFKKQSLSTNP